MAPLFLCLNEAKMVTFLGIIIQRKSRVAFQAAVLYSSRVKWAWVTGCRWDDYGGQDAHPTLGKTRFIM